MNEHSKKAAQSLLDDSFLSSVTRGAKKPLFLFASLSILISATGVQPKQAVILGFEFPKLTPELITTLSFWLLIYSLANFVIHLIPDIARNRILIDDYNRAIANEMDEAIHTPEDPEEEYHESEYRANTGYRQKTISRFIIGLTIYSKIALEFVFPVLYGFSSIIYYYCSRK